MLTSTVIKSVLATRSFVLFSKQLQLSFFQFSSSLCSVIVVWFAAAAHVVGTHGRRVVGAAARKHAHQRLDRPLAHHLGPGVRRAQAHAHRAHVHRALLVPQRRPVRRRINHRQTPSHTCTLRLSSSVLSAARATPHCVCGTSRLAPASVCCTATRRRCGACSSTATSSSAAPTTSPSACGSPKQEPLAAFNLKRT